MFPWLLIVTDFTDIFKIEKKKKKNEWKDIVFSADSFQSLKLLWQKCSFFKNAHSSLRISNF